MRLELGKHGQGYRVETVQWVALAIVGLAVSYLLILPIIRLGFKIEIDYNEGWNIYYGLRAIALEPLYDYKNEWTQLCYPPLSFYVVGGIGTVIHNPIVAGRLISLLSLFLISVFVAVIVKKLGARPFDILLAGILCTGFFSAHATHYVAMHDPQMLGHVFMSAALLIYILSPMRTSSNFLVVLLLSLGLYTKHSLLSVPLSIFIDSFLRSRYLFFKLLVCFIVIQCIFFVATLMLAGDEFFNHIYMPRSYSLEKMMTYSLKTVGFKMLAPLVLVVPCFTYAFKHENIRIVSIYLVTSLVIPIYFVGGAGTDVNLFFDLFISVAILSGTFSFLLSRNTFKYKLFSSHLVSSFLPLFLSLGIFAMMPAKLWRQSGVAALKDGLWTPKIYNALKSLEGTTLQDAAFLASKPGPVICENLLMCYLANKPFEYDPMDTSVRMMLARVSERNVINSLESHYFGIVQLNSELPHSYSRNVSYTAVCKDNLNDRLTQNIKRALAKHYKVARLTLNGAFYIPRS